MKLSVVTCTTPGRRVAFDLCRKYVERQTRQPDEWLVMDDATTPMPQKVLQALGRMTGDAIVWAEDDDWYAPGWLSWVEKSLEQGFDLVGEGEAIYYHVSRRWWSPCKNVRHASLCQTAMRMTLREELENTIRAWDNPFFDCRLWRVDAKKMLRLPRDGERLVIGIKGMPGTPGYSPEHRQKNPPGCIPDPALLKLWQLIGKDAAAYAPFYLK